MIPLPMASPQHVWFSSHRALGLFNEIRASQAQASSHVGLISYEEDWESDMLELHGVLLPLSSKLPYLSMRRSSFAGHAMMKDTTIVVELVVDSWRIRNDRCEGYKLTRVRAPLRYIA